MALNSTLRDIFSFSLLIFLLLLIVAGLVYFQKDDKIDSGILSTQSGPDEHSLLLIANTSLDVVRMLSKGSIITDGPRMVDDIDRDNMPSLFMGIQGDVYIMRISSEQKDLFVVMNSTSVIKTVPLTMFSQPQ